jgi:formylglycine-generating enzyme required for sulfatase activity
VSKYPITVAEYARFVADTHYDAGNACLTYEDRDPIERVGRNWRRVDFNQTITDPALCVNWDDARAYVAWLSKKTGHSYRLLSESEYEYSNRAGAETAYWWGGDPSLACRYSNGADSTLRTHFPNLNVNTCGDGYMFTSPVGSFTANPFGLYDVTGNVWSWVADCFNADYSSAPLDGSANVGGDCKEKTIRGGGWNSDPGTLRSANRDWRQTSNRDHFVGFRVARSL